MRQKFLIQKNDDKNELKIKEFANLDREYKFSELVKNDKEFFSLLCEETYDRKTMRSAIKKGKEDLISTLRTSNMYPISSYADIIADSVIKLYASENSQTVELLFDDKEFLSNNFQPTPIDNTEKPIEVKK